MRDRRDTTARTVWTAPSMLDKDPETLATNLLEPATMEAVRDAARAVLGARPDARALVAAARRAVEIAEQVWADLKVEGPRYDCRKGCAWCCHQTVMVTAPEVFMVLDHLWQRLDDAALDALAARLATASAAIGGRTTAERMRRALACGLLEDGACSIHPGRPLPCRGGFSRNVGFCEALFGDPEGVVAEVAAGRREGPFLLVPKMIFDSAQVGLVTALRELGYACRPLELTTALAIAVPRRNIIEAWLADELVFAAAELRRAGRDYVTSAAPLLP